MKYITALKIVEGYFQNQIKEVGMSPFVTKIKIL